MPAVTTVRDTQMETYQLDETKIGSDKLFPSTVEDHNALGIGYHGTTVLAATDIECSGFKPLSETIEQSRQELLLRLSKAFFPQEHEDVCAQFKVMIHVNYFPISELALKHTEQRGGQGIYVCLQPLIEKLLAHGNLNKTGDDWLMLREWRSEIEAIQKSPPIVYAVCLRELETEITWNLNGAYQVRGTVKPDKIIAKLEAPSFSDFGRIDREALEAKAKSMAFVPGHFAKRVFEK